jgi:nitroreductase
VLGAPFVAVFLADLRPHVDVHKIIDLERRAGKSPLHLRALEADARLFAAGEGGSAEQAVKAAALQSLSLAAAAFAALGDLRGQAAAGGCGSDGSGAGKDPAKEGVADQPGPCIAIPTANSAEAWGFKATSLAAMTYLLSCTAHGLATAPMEGFDAGLVKKAIGMPALEACRYAVPIVVPTGYAVARTESTAGQVSPRLPLREVVSLNSWGNAFE